MAQLHALEAPDVAQLLAGSENGQRNIGGKRNFIMHILAPSLEHNASVTNIQHDLAIRLSMFSRREAGREASRATNRLPVGLASGSGAQE